ncbi:TonB-dependent receptor [Chitinophaga rhizosphaerae]|uniref:TonB-dependent receptor n=1 Tax=Chitinophaga rhizosphaerae TaxID=1864947 RepID=UPI0013DFFF3E|nr:TonB-dependent receptor [Chitinophaga rhizosphaerae]
MRWTAFLILAACLNVSATTYAQRVTVKLQNASLEEVFSAVKRQTGYLFFYDRELLRSAEKVTIQASNQPLESFLLAVFKDQPLDYSVKDKTIFIKPKPVTPAAPSANAARQEVTGTVTGTDGTPLPGVTIRIKGTQAGATTDVDGKFKLNAEPGDVLVISYIGFEQQEVTVGAGALSIRLKPNISALDEAVVIGYGSAVRKSLTGSVSSVRSKDIANSPVTDPLAAMQGRVPGLFITANSGLPGTTFNVTLRGQNSLLKANGPLFVIDGVPYLEESMNTTIPVAGGNQSPLAALNPADIERIDVLKDADATAIYGSRAANGVVMITTKKGRAGKTSVNANVYSGASRVVNRMPMLSTAEYLAMRKEAFANDNLTPTTDNAPDLLEWSQTENNDWQKRLIGNTANQTEAQLSASGGTAQTRYLLSGTFRRETTVLPNDLAYKRGTGHFSLDHKSKNSRFGFRVSANYTGDKNNSLPSDMSYVFSLSPNYPVYGPDGKFYWFSSDQNPIAPLSRTYNSKLRSLITNGEIRYTVLPGLTAKVTGGYTNTTMEQMQITPPSSLNAQSSANASTYFGDTKAHSYVVEPQLEFKRAIGKGDLSVLAGTSWQENIRDGKRTDASRFSGEEFMHIMDSAGVRNENLNYYMYRYNSIFGRVTYNRDGKYILNANFRRDGSTRFGPDNRWGNFGSIGAAWIFSDEPWMKQLSWLSHGKLRGSYGSVGSDNIGYYDYLASWAASNSAYIYDGSTGLTPSRIANPEYHWEVSRKSEGGIELGFLKNRILFNAGYYHSLTDNQLIDLSLTPQVGFSGLRDNFDAVVQNAGWEMDLTTDNIRRDHFSWTTSVNITIPKNKLKKFDGIEKTVYRDKYVVGEPLTIVKGYQFQYVDPANGKPVFWTKDGSGGRPVEFTDFVILGNAMPEYYGGLQNSLKYKKVELDFLFQFVQQEGGEYNYGRLANAYGMRFNQGREALDRWQKPGDITDIPRATTTQANTLFDVYRLSSAVWGNASYIRLKNVSLRYDLSEYARKIKLNRLVVYANAQNLLTFTNYKGIDPETQGIRLPPVKAITAGIQLSL